jgi:hypothetical protein
MFLGFLTHSSHLVRPSSHPMYLIVKRMFDSNTLRRLCFCSLLEQDEQQAAVSLSNSYRTSHRRMRSLVGRSLIVRYCQGSWPANIFTRLLQSSFLKCARVHCPWDNIKPEIQNTFKGRVTSTTDVGTTGTHKQPCGYGAPCRKVFWRFLLYGMRIPYSICPLCA